MAHRVIISDVKAGSLCCIIGSVQVCRRWGVGVQSWAVVFLIEL